MTAAYEVARLDDIERRGNRIPIRRHFGIAAFGINAWTGDAGDEVIGTHTEEQDRHEEVYVVVSGRAEFTVAENVFDAPIGTAVFVRDPLTQRGAVAREDGTVVLTVGARPGDVFTPSAWEENAEVMPLFAEGRYAEAAERLRAVHERDPRAGGILYNLACAEARLGETEAAIGHLADAIAIHAPFAELARDDEDFGSIRDDPRFPAA